MTVKRIRRKATEQEKIFAKDIFDKGLFPKIYKDFLKLHKKIKNLILKTAKDLNIPHQRRYIDSKYEELSRVACHQENANLKNSEVALDTF